MVIPNTQPVNTITSLYDLTISLFTYYIFLKFTSILVILCKRNELLQYDNFLPSLWQIMCATIMGHSNPIASADFPNIVRYHMERITWDLLMISADSKYCLDTI